MKNKKPIDELVPSIEQLCQSADRVSNVVHRISENKSETIDLPKLKRGIVYALNNAVKRVMAILTGLTDLIKTITE